MHLLALSSTILQVVDRCKHSRCQSGSDSVRRGPSLQPIRTRLRRILKAVCGELHTKNCFEQCWHDVHGVAKVKAS